MSGGGSDVRPGSWQRDVLSRQLHEPLPVVPKASGFPIPDREVPSTNLLTFSDNPFAYPATASSPSFFY
ncbi:hypothetical protein B0X71_05070 [Planococcus lenghuensis]|uniref:Uncharacterized protein n=1 Tax=Planococcus lenghuensis TaxID=2213202 RepID=A0A1Q2KWM4_9BACL|nr:hypothetical protein B0X71_05070 [Planococcus lenghuensis]